MFAGNDFNTSLSLACGRRRGRRSSSAASIINLDRFDVIIEELKPVFNRFPIHPHSLPDRQNGA